ncbi:hypothetical protein D3C73_1005380 [compost metagenome]
MVHLSDLSNGKVSSNKLTSSPSLVFPPPEISITFAFLGSAKSATDDTLITFVVSKPRSLFSPKDNLSTPPGKSLINENAVR